MVFLSTLPAWGATVKVVLSCARVRYFYPRSPRGERHVDNIHMYGSNKHFYPRSPRGERQGIWGAVRVPMSFLSTLPAWGATYVAKILNAKVEISIHAPRVGSDPLSIGMTP